MLLVRRVEKFAFTFLIADVLILTTVIVIIVYASIHIHEKKVWGEGVKAVNGETFLTMIGSAVFSYEGIGVVIPIIEVTNDPKNFHKIVLYVLMTVAIMYTGFGMFCLMVYGDELKNPLITESLDKTWPVYVIKVLFSINIVISITLQIFPVNIILEDYTFSGVKKSLKRKWLKNL